MVESELQELLEDFLLECDERLLTIESALLEISEPGGEDRSSLLESVRRDLHTLKGNSGMMGLPDMQTLAHRLEDTVGELDPRTPDISPLLTGVDEFKSLLEALREPAPQEQATPEEAAPEAPGRGSVRVPTEDLDLLLDLTTEVLVVRNRLAEITGQGLALDPDSPDYGPSSQAAWRELEESRLELEKALIPLDDGLRRLRMVPLKSLFGRLQRIVHDEAVRGEKDVKLVTRGEDTPLDAALVEVAADALGHLVRNAIVHGIEQPDVRAAKAKPGEGTVLLTASVRGRWVEIEVLDDGAGINYDKLRLAAERLGMEISAEADLHALVFRSGVTTRSEADQSSGRGIGTAAVLEAVHRYGGTIDIDTAMDVGSRFLLRLPLTVAVTDALVLETEATRFALPIGSILETASADENELTSVDGEKYLDREGLKIPATDVAEFLRLAPASQPRESAVVLTLEGKLHALLIDQLGDVATIVVNPLDPALGQPPGIAGTTVLGNGDVIMILDPQAFLGSPAELAS